MLGWLEYSKQNIFNSNTSEVYKYIYIHVSVSVSARDRKTYEPAKRKITGKRL